MTPTKLLLGQILLVFAIVIAGIWFATQWAATELAYQPELGPASFTLLGRPIYRPWAIFLWWYRFDAYAPRVFARAGAIALEPAPSPYLLSAGSVIAASLITGLRSDVPGLVTAQVTENVYDSATGRILLIPQGARLIGTYDSVVAYGQSRALVVWQRIVFPDGSSLRIDNVPAADPSGYAGLADKVDFHTWSLLKGIALSTLLGVTPELALSGDGDLVQAIRRSSQDNVARAGDQLTSRNLQVQPTITIRPGAPVRLVVHRDLILEPWRL